jgi:hypothetical protein
MAAQASDQYGPSPAATYASPGSQMPAQQKAQAIPFVRASRRASQQDFAQTLTMNTGQQQLGPFDIQTNGFLRFLELYTVCTTAGNSATTAFNTGTNDAPFIALTNNTLQDPSSEFIVNPYTGYELMLAEKYFNVAQTPYSDPRADPNYVLTTGPGATGGSFAFVLRVPLEDRQRDALAAVPNSAANKNYRYTTFLNSSSSVYSTAPTTLGSVAVSCTNFYWTEPPASIGNTPTVATPNGNGTVAYLDREVFTAISSQTNPTIIFKNVGRVYKSAIFVLRLSSGARDGTLTDWPNPLAIWINGFPLYYKPQHTWFSEMQELFGFTATALGTFDGVGTLDTGVYVWHDLDVQPGVNTNWGSADQYLATVASTKIQLVGSWGATANNLTILQRTIKPSSAAALYS